MNGGIQEFFQTHPNLCAGTQFPPLKADLGTIRIIQEIQKILCQKPKIRKTKEELLLEVDKGTMIDYKGRPPSANRGFNARAMKMDPRHITTNKAFNAIPDPDRHLQPAQKPGARKVGSNRLQKPTTAPKDVLDPADRYALYKRPKPALTDKPTRAKIDYTPVEPRFQH